ncbi:sugar phosphate isomerase/epimerase [Roseinatronobacter sp. S2]|uniref:sugar phosphate isomerase/epimerase family protein n=1 Tax=Roseinatronobacter sp. S2 TaxID=3035471 RepID=UPI00240EBDA9|nr:sugar phosphate isomerase/epimerase [Roseinatronobacter sp. S2]WFE73358.1 sugar phosphate isomerase/epimerase [Roseinatronobacter sp. S2]
MPTISYQLYCSRNFPPLAETLAMIAATGFTNVEGYGGLFDDIPALKAMLDAEGLHMSSSHMGLDLVEGDPDRAVSIATGLGMSRVYVPHLAPDQRPKDGAGWTAFGKRLAKAGAPLRDAGLVFGWHNHDFELDDLGSGDTPLDMIITASDELSLELDLGWLRFAGHDPLAWIAKYGSRISAVHVKDIAPNGSCTDEDGWADMGHGVMDWNAIMPALATAGISHFVMEHDNPKDHARFASRSLATLKTF